MVNKQKGIFGGEWTIDKLDILSNYLNFYVQALKNQNFKKIYIDAFAGNGKNRLKINGEIIETEGSVRIALNARTKFDKYIFIEKNPKKCEELKNIVNNEYNDLASKVKIINGDATQVLTEICQKFDWRKNRALLFLDPFATQVPWQILTTIRNTKAIDLWYLFPLHAVIRLMKRDKKMPNSWANRLNIVFGDNSWERELYIEDPQLELFSYEIKYKKKGIDKLIEYIKKKLKLEFPYVAEKHKILYNRTNFPLFLLCFAVSNPSTSAWGLAAKIAKHILK